ncbi:MAG: sulfur carrier protein ThiS [Candidatus Delongbacteria bacterium]|nr:sulfur carrier protein ThiS [Candidatus Delongbacteria bacterium]MCG2761543.1 sulfur carrier protein ThiS [Candidatus Delongbacteria bacterium]
MEVIVNGKIEEIESETILKLILGKSLNPNTLVIEMNGKIIIKDNWENTKIKQNDKIEILNFVGGG